MAAKTYKPMQVWPESYWDLRAIAAHRHEALIETFHRLVRDEIARLGLAPCPPINANGTAKSTDAA